MLHHPEASYNPLYLTTCSLVVLSTNILNFAFVFLLL